MSPTTLTRKITPRLQPPNSLTPGPATVPAAPSAGRWRALAAPGCSHTLSCCLTSSILLPAPSLPTCLSQSAPPERASLACPLSHPPSLPPCWTALQALIAPHSPAFSPRKAHIPRFCALTCAWHIAGPQCINVYQTNKCSPGGSHTQSHVPLCVPIPT